MGKLLLVVCVSRTIQEPRGRREKGRGRSGSGRCWRFDRPVAVEVLLAVDLAVAEGEEHRDLGAEAGGRRPVAERDGELAGPRSAGDDAVGGGLVVPVYVVLLPRHEGLA